MLRDSRVIRAGAVVVAGLALLAWDAPDWAESKSLADETPSDVLEDIDDCDKRWHSACLDHAAELAMRAGGPWCDKGFLRALFQRGLLDNSTWRAGGAPSHWHDLAALNCPPETLAQLVSHDYTAPEWLEYGPNPHHVVGNLARNAAMRPEYRAPLAALIASEALRDFVVTKDPKATYVADAIDQLVYGCLRPVGNSMFMPVRYPDLDAASKAKALAWCRGPEALSLLRGLLAVWAAAPSTVKWLPRDALRLAAAGRFDAIADALLTHTGITAALTHGTQFYARTGMVQSAPDCVFRPHSPLLERQCTQVVAWLTLDYHRGEGADYMPKILDGLQNEVPHPLLGSPEWYGRNALDLAVGAGDEALAARLRTLGWTETPAETIAERVALLDAHREAQIQVFLEMGLDIEARRRERAARGLCIDCETPAQRAARQAHQRRLAEEADARADARSRALTGMFQPGKANTPPTLPGTTAPASNGSRSPATIPSYSAPAGGAPAGGAPAAALEMPALPDAGARLPKRCPVTVIERTVDRGCQDACKRTHGIRVVGPQSCEGTRGAARDACIAGFGDRVRACQQGCVTETQRTVMGTCPDSANPQ